MGYVVYAWTDGASTGKVGPGGWAFLMLIADRRWKRGSAPARRTTNQRMEMIAAIMALREAPPNSHVTIYSDSAYLVNGMNRAWWSNWVQNGWRTYAGKPVKNRELWEALLDAEGLHERVDWVHVAGHVSARDHTGRLYQGNRLADRLAVRAKMIAIREEVD